MMGATEPEIKARVHIYASGREFVVVPVISDSARGALELQPVERVKLVIGRATVVDLARALRETMQRSRAARVGDDEIAVVTWDGDHGRWWAHNLLFVVLKWGAEELEVSRQERATEGDWRSVHTDRLPARTPFADIAEDLVRALGQQLHR